MSKEQYNNETVVQYLLGTLPEAEAEALDELSFTDDEFAAALSVAEKDLVDAYMQGELSGPTLEQFKAHYLASPLRRERVQFAQALQTFAAQAATAQTEETVAEKREHSLAKSKSWFSTLSIFTAPRLAWQWGMAFAALVLLIGGGWLLLENMRLRRDMMQTDARREALDAREQALQQELAGQRAANATTEEELARVRAERERLAQELKDQAAQRSVEQQRAAKQQTSALGGISVASFILTPQLRGSSQSQTISLPAKTGYVALRLQLEPNDYHAYRVALLDEANQQTLWRSDKLTARTTSDGETLSVRLRVGLLKPQAYVLRVMGVAANGASEIVSAYPFRVVK
jgi:hypothetical protein